MSLAKSLNPKAIIVTEVPVRERCACFPGYFGDHFIQTENTVYAFAENLVVGYRGEFWDFFRVSNGGFFVAPRKALLYEVMVPFGNNYRGEMSARAAGLVVCIFAYNFLAEKTGNELFIDQADYLKAYADGHPEGPKIFAAID